MEILIKQLQEIDKMNVVKIIGGHFVSTGSFIANDIDGNEYFAHSTIVKSHQNKFNSLNGNNTSFWVLVEKQNWGVNRENREEISVKAISETKEDCLNFKANLLYKIILRWNLNDLHQQEFDAIGTQKVNNEISFSNGIEILQRFLADLNIKIDNC